MSSINSCIMKFFNLFICKLIILMLSLWRQKALLMRPCGLPRDVESESELELQELPTFHQGQSWSWGQQKYMQLQLIYNMCDLVWLDEVLWGVAAWGVVWCGWMRCGGVWLDEVWHGVAGLPCAAEDGRWNGGGDGVRVATLKLPGVGVKNFHA